MAIRVDYSIIDDTFGREVCRRFQVFETDDIETAKEMAREWKWKCGYGGSYSVKFHSYEYLY